jgi:hypothetical protein
MPSTAPMTLGPPQDSPKLTGKGSSSQKIGWKRLIFTKKLDNVPKAQHN